MDKYIYGGDTETVRGLPMTLQFYSEDVACNDIYWVKEDTAADVTIKWCSQRRRNVQHVCYVHHLKFDLIELLFGHHAKFAKGDFEFRIGKWRVKGVYGTPTFCKVSNGHDITVMFVDSFSYFRESLAKWADKNRPDLKKLKHPDGLGEKRFKKSDSKFIDYAMRDAEIAYHMGKEIERLHQEFDLEQCLSVAHMSAQIFRRKYLTYTIPQPSREIIDASLLSYHGGKNNITGESGWYEDITSVDLKSAYPDALASFPAFSNAKLYRRYRASRGIRSVPDLGVYCVSGRLADCAYPVIFSHGFKPLCGDIDQVWVQGYELNEALRSKEFKPSKITGHFYDRERDLQAPALRFFVDDIFARKEAATDPVLRNMYKLVANSISGKLIQTRKRGSSSFTDIDAHTTVAASELTAGGLFHPFIASATTAHTRARIHRVEHRIKALHTATDGCLTQARGVKHEGDGLGDLAVEVRGATLLMLRNKTYILYVDKALKNKTQPSKAFKGKHIYKYALHGFMGDVFTLERLIATNRRKYTINRPNTLKESLKKGLVPNDFVRHEYTLRIPPLQVKRA